MNPGFGPDKEWNAMELELERIGLNGYEAALETTVCQE